MKLPSFISLLGFTVAAHAQAPAKVTYTDHIAPIFRNACTNCHNPDKKKAGLDLTTYEGTMAGGESGPAVKPGNGDSLIYKLSAHLDEPKMPPKGDKLTDAELKLLKDWITGFALENANSKPAQVAANKVDVAVVSLTRPDGPPPMPGDLPMDPFVRPRGATAVVAMAASPWAPLVAIGGQKQVFLYNTNSMEQLGVLSFPEGYPNVLHFSRNAKLLLAAGGLGGKSGKVVLWDVATGDRAGVVGNEADAVLAADISPDHQFVALGGPERRVKIYRIKDGKMTSLIKKHTEWITAITYSPDGKYLATADRNGGVEIWEAGAEPKPYNTLAGHKAACTALAFMPGVLASASEDGKVTLWNVKEGTEIKSWNAHAGGVQWAEFSPDGRLATCGRDKIAKIWDQTGKQLAATEAFGDLATRCTLSGEKFIAADWTGDIRVFGADGKKIGALTTNPPGILEQIAAAEKSLSESTAALPALQKALADAEAKVKAEKEAAEAKRKADLAAAEARKAEAWKRFEAAKAAPTQAEKTVAEATALVAANTAAAAKAEALAKEKGKAPTAGGDPAKSAALEAAKKKVADLTAELTKLREARAKFAEGTPGYRKEDDAVQVAKPQLAKAEETLAAAQAQVQAGGGNTNASGPEAAAAAQARNAVEAAKQQLAQAQKALETAKSAAPKQIADAEKAVAEADRAIGELKNGTAAPAPAPAPAANPKIAELQKTLENLNKELETLREARRKHAEGSAEYVKATEPIRAKKDQIKNTEDALAAAQKSPAAPAAAGVAKSEGAQAFDKAQAELAAAQTRLATARAGLDRWKRAQLYQTVFNARQVVVDKKAKYEDSLATAKDAFRQVELTKQAVIDSEKTVANGPKIVAEKEAAYAALKQAADAAASALAAAEKAVADKKAVTPDTKGLEAEINDLQTKSTALTVERQKLKEERDKTTEGSPEFTALQAKREELKAKVADLDAKLVAARAKKEGKPTPVPPELLEAVKKATLDLKLAKDKVAPAEKAVAEAKKAIEDAKKQIPDLKARIPKLQAEAVKVKADAEKAAATLAKELRTAEAEAEKLRTQFEAVKKASTSTAMNDAKS